MRESREDLLKYRLEGLKEQIGATNAQLRDVNNDLEIVDFQLEAHKHDQKKYLARHKLLKAEAAIVSLKEWRSLQGDLEFMEDVIDGLEKRKLALEKKRQVLIGDFEDLDEVRQGFQHELDVMVARANVYPFPQRDDTGRDEDQSAE